VKYYLYTTRRGLPIYYNLPVHVGYLPSSYSKFQEMMRKARFQAERKIYQRLKRRVKGKLEFFIIRGSYIDVKFISIFDSVIVDPFGNILKLSAPRREHRDAYRLYVDYLRDRYVKTGDSKWWYKYLGVSMDPNYLEKRLRFKQNLEESQVKLQRILTPFDPPEQVFKKKSWIDKILF